MQSRFTNEDPRHKYANMDKNARDRDKPEEDELEDVSYEQDDEDDEFDDEWDMEDDYEQFDESFDDE